MSARLTEEMLDEVVYQNWQDVINFTTTNAAINITILRDACHTARSMYYDVLVDYVGEIKDEDFFYSIPEIERKEIIDELQNVNPTTNAFTYDAILDNSISSLEFLMLLEYEKVIDGDCDSIIFNVSVK